MPFHHQIRDLLHETTWCPLSFYAAVGYCLQIGLLHKLVGEGEVNWKQFTNESSSNYTIDLSTVKIDYPLAVQKVYCTQNSKMNSRDVGFTLWSIRTSKQWQDWEFENLTPPDRRIRNTTINCRVTEVDHSQQYAMLSLVQAKATKTIFLLHKLTLERPLADAELPSEGQLP